MVTIVMRYAQLAKHRRVRAGATCPGHDFQDVPVDPGKRLAVHELACHRCGMIVPILAAWLYEMGKRHGAEQAARCDSLNF